MTANSLKGLALFLVLAGIFLALAGAIGALVTGDRRLMLITTAGCALQLLGWRSHTSPTGGA